MLLLLQPRPLGNNNGRDRQRRASHNNREQTLGSRALLRDHSRDTKWEKKGQGEEDSSKSSSRDTRNNRLTVSVDKGRD